VINTEQKIYFEQADECEVVYLVMYVTGHEVREGEHLYISIHSLIAVLVGGGRAKPRSGLITCERSRAHSTRGWVVLRAGLDGCGTFHPPTEFDLRTVQPVASR
jgi:hypothetical protein